MHRLDNFRRSPLLVILVACILIGVYCSFLNIQLYTHKQPFYDSLSYYIKMHQVMDLARNESMASALTEACFGQNTVCLPYLIAIGLSNLVAPSRLIGVWIQAVELFLCLVTIYFYARCVKQFNSLLSVILSLSVLTAACLFYDNGGMSDFRMDLSLMLLFSTTCLLYLIASSNGSWISYGLLGLVAGCACLFRATSPVFLLAACVPIVMVDLFMHQAKLWLAMKLSLSISMAASVAGWFYVANFEYLNFYYFVWNTDANADLSWRESFRHLTLVSRGMGEPMLLLILAWTGVAIFSARSKHRLTEWVIQCWNSKTIDLRLLWIGTSPLIVLVGTGAGLNPFVGLISIIGLALFAILPALSWFQQNESLALNRFVLFTLGLMIIVAGLRGLKNHNDSDINTMNAHQTVLNSIISDAKTQGITNATFTTTHLTGLDTKSLFSVLLFDRADAHATHTHVTIDHIALTPRTVFSIASESDWNDIPGATVAQKLDHLFFLARHRVNYLIVPDGRSTSVVENQSMGKHINRHCQEIQRRVGTSNEWHPIGNAIQTDVLEWVQIYRRNPLNIPATRR